MASAVAAGEPEPPELEWFPLHPAGEATASGNNIEMGVRRSCLAGQARGYHGMYAVLPPADAYEVRFFHVLRTWDSYSGSGGAGYYDSFSVSVSSVPHGHAGIPGFDPLTAEEGYSPGFVWGGEDWINCGQERSNGELTVTMAAEWEGPKYLNVVLDTHTSPDGDNKRPSSGRIEILEVRSLTPGQLVAYVDAGFSTKLEDWPEEEGRSRSPKALFGNDDPIYLRLERPGGDPGSAEDVAVRVTSESDPAGLVVLLRETAVDSNIYDNVTAPGELLYLDRETSEGSNDRIKILDEEVLSFTVIDEPSLNLEVMVDRGEHGEEWQSRYGTYSCSRRPVLPTLVFSPWTSREWGLGLAEHRPGWERAFANGDLDSREAHWSAATDEQHVDSVDIAWWTGHGVGHSEVIPYLDFFVDQDCSAFGAMDDHLRQDEASFGETDVEYLVFNTCNFLRTSPDLPIEEQVAELQRMMGGAHLLLGYGSSMKVYRDAGGRFAFYVDRFTLQDAWFEQARDFQWHNNDPTTVRVFGAVDRLNDWLPVKPGRGAVPRDPSPTLDTYAWEEIVVVPR
ncbi:MAG: DUF6345 domain-containing protein [Acidobacteriota bacterium]